MQELEHAMRRASGIGAIFSQAVADYAGISSSDLECLDFLNLEGRATAGRLAEVTGLTTGAITGVIDRLEGSLQDGAAPRRPLTWEERQALLPYFEADIQLLTEITGGNYESWLRPRVCQRHSPSAAGRRVSHGRC